MSLVKSNAQHGKFIVLEGIEGCGKTTLLHALAEHYRSLEKTVLVTREPGGTPLGEVIRETVLKQKNISIHPLSELLLMEAARHQHCQDILIPALKTHHFIFCDRFTLSSFAYQGKARSLGMDLVAQLNDLTTQNCKPDLVLFIDVPADEALSRRNLRNQENPHCLDKIELETLAFHQHVAQGYQEALSLEPHVRVLNGHVSPKSLLSEAIKVIDAL